MSLFLNPNFLLPSAQPVTPRSQAVNLPVGSIWRDQITVTRPANAPSVQFGKKFMTGAVDFSGSVFDMMGLTRVYRVPATDQADVPTLRRIVETLSRIDRSYENPAGLEEAASFIKQEFQRLGLTVLEQPFTVRGQTYRNLSVTLGPKEGERLIIGAHYDVCAYQLSVPDHQMATLAERKALAKANTRITSELRHDMPGADDNASGVAGLIELARLLKAQESQLKQPVELVAFTLEEPPNFATRYMGSAYHARSLADPEAVRGMIALDMIGYFRDEKNSQKYPVSLLSWLYGSKGDYVSVIGELPSWSWIQKVRHAMRKNSTVPIKWLSAPSSVPGIDFSDHRNYSKLGIPAAMVTDTAFYRNPNYHRATDTPDTLDYPRMAQVVRSLLGTTLTVAGK